LTRRIKKVAYPDTRSRVPEGRRRSELLRTSLNPYKLRGVSGSGIKDDAEGIRCWCGLEHLVAGRRDGIKQETAKGPVNVQRLTPGEKKRVGEKASPKLRNYWS